MSNMITGQIINYKYMTKEIENLIKRSFLRDIMINVLKNELGESGLWTTKQILQMLDNMDENLK